MNTPPFEHMYFLLRHARQLRNAKRLAGVTWRGDSRFSPPVPG